MTGDMNCKLEESLISTDTQYIHMYIYFMLHLLMIASCPYSESALCYFQGNMDSNSLDSPKRVLHILSTQDTW